MLNIDDLEKRICDLVKLSIKDKQYSQEINFPIPQKTIFKVKKKIFSNLENYVCVIHSDEIRHIYKEHGDEVKHICKIYSYLEKFAKIEKSSTRNKTTGINIPCLVFIKKNSPNDIKIIKMNISKDKKLKLKTMFEV